MIDLFNTRTMLAAVEQIKLARKFLLNTFFQTTVPFDTKTVDIDLYKGRRRISAYVERREEGNNIGKIPFETTSFEPPYLKPKMVITVDDLLKRNPGQNIYGAQSGQQRAAEMIGRNMADLSDIIDRNEEVQASQALFDGVVTCRDTDGNIVAQIDFQRSTDNAETLTGSARWDQSGANPLADIRRWRRVINKKTDLVADAIIMGESSLDAFLANDEVKSYLDNRRFPNNAQLAMEAQAMGAVFVGTIEGYDIWGYDSWFLDMTNLDTAGDPKEVALVPEKKVLVASRQARTSRLYGVIEDIEEDRVFAVPRFPKSWTEKDPSVRYLQMHSAPLVCTHEVDAYFVGEVLS